MTPLGWVKQAARPSQPPVHVVPDLQLHIEDALASARRLWVRGRLLGGRFPLVANHGRWWRRWRRKKCSRPALPLAVHLETRISGHLFEADVPLERDGHFEATFPANLPLARRGWQIARNRLTWADETVEKCGVVVRPPDEAHGVTVVILPLEFTSLGHGAQRMAGSAQAARLTPVLRRLHESPGDLHAIYYVACVSGNADLRQAELALAATTLGWPPGTFLLLPAREDPSGTLATALDRLRWLFADTLDLIVLNLEPAFAAASGTLLQPKEERAIVSRLINRDDPGIASRQRKQPEDVAIRTARSSLVPRYPVVFCHGMLAMTTLRMQLPEDLNCFSALREFLRERGYRALFPQVGPTSGIVARARQLREQILDWTDEPVNVIAHSMGGLDARYLITHLDLAGRVRSLTTIATPHRGTYLVDWFLTNFHSRVPLLLALEAMGMNVDGFRDCRRSACRTFNERTPNMPGVSYFSYAGAVSSSRITPLLRRAWSVLNAVEGPNDGMVSLESARWGEYLGVVHADHFAQTPDRVFVRPGEDFDALAFYFRLLEDLARRGF
jgi:triacylglycerol lipase